MSNKPEITVKDLESAGENPATDDKQQHMAPKKESVSQAEEGSQGSRRREGQESGSTTPRARRSRRTVSRRRERGLEVTRSWGSTRSISSAFSLEGAGDSIRTPTSSHKGRARCMCEVPDLGEGHGVVNLTTITGAAYRIRNGIEKTACEKLAPFTEIEDYDVFVKREYLQPTGSFKVRGARNALLTLTPEQKGRGVITTSAGNHGLALAQQGDELGIPVMVLLPENVSPLKVKLCNRYNATTKLAGRNATEVRNMAIKFESEGGCGPIYIDENENTHVISGQGTMGLEIVDQVEDVDAIIVPVGGGGLLAGISVAVKTLYPDIQIIGVEAAACPSFQAAMSAGKPVKVKAEMWLTLAEGLSFSIVSELPFQLARKRLDKIVSVSEEHIALAVLRLLEKERIIIEGSGAAGLAALIGGYLPELKGKRVVVPLCGGNIESTTLGRAIERGLYADHRMVRFVVRIGDRPGALARLLHTISSIGASVKDLYQERTWLNSSVYNIQVKVVAELRNAAHGKELRSMLLHRYHEDLQWNTTNDEG